MFMALKVNCDKHLHGGLHNLAQNFLFGVSPLFAFFFSGFSNFTSGLLRDFSFSNGVFRHLIWNP